MIRYAYVMSHSYSGSTLSSFLLAAHPDVATIGEMGIADGIDIETYLCSCGSPIVACGFWQEVSRRMQERGVPFDVRDADLRFRINGDGMLDRLLRAGIGGRAFEIGRALAFLTWPRARRERERLLRRNEALAHVVTEIRNGKAFVDISKRPGRLVHLRGMSGFEIKVIHLIRDARAVSFSCVKNLGVSAEEGARSWIAFYEQAERAMGWFRPEDCITVRYEDLCRETEATLNRIYALIGVAPAGPVGDFRAVEQHIIGNRMRLASSSEIRLDESWKTGLSEEQIAAVDAIAGEANRRLGYTR